MEEEGAQPSIGELFFALENCSSDEDFAVQVDLLSDTIISFSSELLDLKEKLSKDKGTSQSILQSEYNRKMSNLIPFYILLSYRDNPSLRDGFSRVVTPSQPFVVREQELVVLDNFCFVSYVRSLRISDGFDIDLFKDKWENLTLYGNASPFKKYLIRFFFLAFSKFGKLNEQGKKARQTAGFLYRDANSLLIE